MEGDGVQVIVESSWNVLQGSLDKCVTVVFLDPETHDPIISTSPRASEKLMLVPPTQPVPCEITVTFQGRLCHVQSFYTLSTARICELYSQSKPKTDGDYICTVKGWIPYENSCFSEEGTEMVSEAADTTHRNGMKERDFIEDNIDESVLSSEGSSTVALNPVVDVKSVSSSSDDSWVDVRLHGSFTSENACVSLTAPECENWHVPLNEHELVNLEDQLDLGRLRSKANAKDTGVEGDSKLDECCEGGVQVKERIVQGNAQQDMFEAELELVNHSPWAAITIRLLSLQNKSLVEVDQIVFLAVSGPVPEAASRCQSADQGSHSLFAMFVPSLLQMSRGISGNSKSVLKCESSSLSCEQAQDMIDKLPAEKMSHSCEPPQGTTRKLPAGAEQIGITSLQNAVTEEGSVQQDSQGRAAHVHTHEACGASKAGSSLNLGGGDQEISQYCDFNGAESQGTVEMGENQEISQQNDFNVAESKRTVEIGRDQEISQQIYSHGAESKRSVDIGEKPLQSDSNAMPSCNCKKFASDFMANGVVSALEAFAERFDRLESLCLRMESYLQRTFESLDQRIMHLEVQHRKASEEADCVTASLKQSSMSVEAPNSQESQPLGKQCTAPSDLPPRAECEEEVSISLTQSIDQVFSEAHVFNEVPNPILLDVVNSDSAVAEKLVKEAPSESQEVSRGTVTMVGSMTMQNKKPRAFLDEAWASALSAFASSFTPVVGAENTVANQMDEQPSGSSHDALISISQECETLRKERNSTKETSHCDVDFVADLMNEANHQDLNLEAFNFEDKPIYEDGAQAPCDEQMPTAHAFPIGTSLEKPLSYSSKTSTSVPNDSFDLLGLKDMLIMPREARTEVNDSLENIDLATMHGFSGLSEDALSACPLFDIFASAHSNSISLRELKDNSPALRGFKTGLSPVFDSTSSEKQDADFLSLGKEETLSNNFQKCQKSRNFFHFEEKNKDYLYNFVDETLTEGAGFQSISSLIIGAPKASQTEENKEEVFCNTSDSSTVDFLGNFISTEKGKVLDMSEVQDPESFNSSLFTYCEAEGATSFPDVLEEDCSNYQDGRASSEDSLCFSQDFDTCPNELCDDEWSCGPNVFYLNDPELTDDETNIAVADVEEKIEMSDISDTDSTEDLPFWPAVHNERIDQQQPTMVFPGFENLS